MAIELETEDLLPPLHPGEILREEFMVPLGSQPYAVAKACGCRARGSSGFIREENACYADTALRLGRYFGMSPQVWINSRGL